MKINQVWYSPNSDIQAPDTIHQILMFGTLKDIQALKKRVGENAVRKLFLGYPKKIYTNASLNFIKNFILNINVSIDEKRYLKYTPRHT